MTNINGLNVVLTTPFNNGQLDLNALKRHITALLPYVSGITLGGTTGESASLSDAELMAMLKEAKALAKEKNLIAGFWRPTIQTTLACAQKLAPLTNALLVPIPKELFHAEDTLIEKFYKELESLVPSPIILYNYPAKSEKYSITPELAKKLAQQCKNIIAVKDSSEDSKLALAVISQNIPLQPLVGNDRFLHKILTLAQQNPNFKFKVASVSGACSVPRIAAIEKDIHELVQRQEHEKAEMLQQKLIQEFFNEWGKYAPELGGQAPIIKELIGRTVADYPRDVRAPLHIITSEISTKLTPEL